MRKLQKIQWGKLLHVWETPVVSIPKSFFWCVIVALNFNHLTITGKKLKNFYIWNYIWCAEKWKSRRISSLENWFDVTGALLRNNCSPVGKLCWPSKTLHIVCIMAKCSFISKFFAFKDKTSKVGGLIVPLDCLSHTSCAHSLQKVNRTFFLRYSYILCPFMFMFEVFLLLWFVTF